MNSEKFNFDSEEHIVGNKTPAAKAINKKFCGKFNAAGLWVADENMLAAGWETTCTENCSLNCVEHFRETQPHSIATTTDEVSGRGLTCNRMCIIRKTDLLRLNNITKRLEGKWFKGDGEILDSEGKKKYSCVRRYLILFVDKDNKPLHKVPIQLTAKGVFQVYFEKHLLNFRSEIQKAYFASTGKSCTGSRMSDLWYAMCVFEPKFISKLAGQKNFQSHACYTDGFSVPTVENWKSFCIDLDNYSSTIVELYKNSDAWLTKQTTVSVLPSEEEQLLEDDTRSIITSF